MIFDTLRETSHTILACTQQAVTITKIIDLLITAYKKGNKMVLFGNGGSAADAQHIATELLGGFNDHSRPSYPALALTTDTSALTAIGNDFSFEEIFSRQVQSMVNSGDVVIAISTSGNSANVIRGAQMAKKRGATVIGFTGESGGKLKNESDVCLCIPSSNTPRIQEAHITIGHIITAAIEEELCKEKFNA